MSNPNDSFSGSSVNTANLTHTSNQRGLNPPIMKNLFLTLNVFLIRTLLSHAASPCQAV